MTTSFDVLIIGGGIVGLSAALSLTQRGFTTAILDSNSFPASMPLGNARVYAINKASKQLFQQLGIWENIEALGISPYTGMHVWDGATDACIDFKAQMIAASELGFIIEENVLRKSILDQLQQTQEVHFFPHNKVIDLQDEGDFFTVNTEQQSLQAALLLVADGKESKARDLLQVPIKSWPYHQHALVATVEVTKPHQHIAYQVFHDQSALAFLPLSKPNTCSIVWSTSSKYVQTLLDMPEEEFGKELSKAFFHKLGEVKLLSKRFQFPLVMRQATQYTGKNWLLMGDAAHSIHPLAGLGLNLGLADLSCFLRLIDKSSQNRSKRDLAAYQRERKQAVWQVIVLLEGIKMLFANPLTPVVALRSFGLKCCNAFNPLKKLFIEQANG